MSKSTKKKTDSSDKPIKFKCFTPNCIFNVMRSRGWVETTGNDWMLYWCDISWIKDNFDNTFLEENTKVCHFRNHYELTRKNLMVKNLKRYRKLLEKEKKLPESIYDYHPMTFELPTEYHMFVEEFRKTPGQIWIMKPVGKSQGKGIFLFKKLKEIDEWKKTLTSNSNFSSQHQQEQKEPVEAYVVQKYIDNPYLIAGRKFDIRAYVLVTSYSPLKAWVYREGFARFSNSSFSLDSISDNYVHLTNVAIQKTAPEYNPDRGSKWSAHRLRAFLTQKHGKAKADECFKQIGNIFTQSLMSVQKVMIQCKHCFEMYGYDILIDEELKPWFIEINASPSLVASDAEDLALKSRLLDDVLNVLDLENRLLGNEKRVGGFDLILDDGLVFKKMAFSEDVEELNMYLGCYNDRVQQLRQLYKQIAAIKNSQELKT